jgi:hypothetical protein
LRGIALELDVEHREALGLTLLDPEGEMDQADDEDDFVDDGPEYELGAATDAGQYDEPAPDACACHAVIVHQAGCPADTTSKEA